MRIVCLIGNGFDIGLGLKTSYRDFLTAYCSENENSDNEMIRWLVNKIERDKNNWSDAEKAFGMLPFSEVMPGKDHPSPLEAYNTCHDELCDFMAGWITSEEQKFVIPEGERASASKEFCNRILRLYDIMEQAPSNQYKLALSSNTGIELSFISFNYTKTLELLTAVPADENGFWTTDAQGNKKVKIEICHAHGTLEGGDIVFGVDNPNQIADEAVREYCKWTGGMLKDKSAELIGSTDRSHSMNVISNADAIILFGLSYGETDRGWWNNIYSRLYPEGKSWLIICPYSDKPNKFWTTKNRDDYRISEIRKVFSSLTGERFGEKDISKITQNQKITTLFHDQLPKDVPPYDFLNLSSLKQRFYRQ